MRAPLYSTKPDELFSVRSIEDPHPLYARLRRDHPLSRVADTGVHLVATWDLIDEVLGRESDFSANITGVLMRGPAGEPSVFELPVSAASHVIATADEPRHAVHRRIAQPRLAAPMARGLETQLQAWTRDAVEAWVRDAGDFVPIAERIPARVVALVLGLPDADVTRYRRWAMMGGSILAGDVRMSDLQALARESSAMNDYLSEHLDIARSGPQTGPEAPLLHALARGVDAGEISHEEAVGIAGVMFGAGGESTAALIESVVRCLAERPEIAEKLRQDRSLIPRLVEEVARLEPPFKFHYRVVRRECTLGGCELGPGDRLMLLWASANRDPAQVEDPDALRLDRSHPKNHMSFGRGPHFCIGAPFARLEARVVCEVLLDVTDWIALSDERPVYARSIFIRRHEALPLQVRPRGT